MVIEELVKSAKATLYDRTISPLFGSFVVSWALWNYKLIVVLFSAYSPERTFQVIEQVLYPTMPRAVGFLLVGPLLTALAFIYLYPWPARKTFEYARRQQQKLIELRDQIDKATLVTKEVWERTQQELAELTAEHSRVTERLEREKDSFKKLFLARDQQIQGLAKEVETLRAVSSRVVHRLSPPISEVDLVGRHVRLFHARIPGLEGSKLLELRAQGDIGYGQNDGEHTWSIEGDVLRFFNIRGESEGAFEWDSNWRLFRRSGDVQGAGGHRDFVVVEP